MDTLETPARFASLAIAIDAYAALEADSQSLLNEAQAKIDGLTAELSGSATSILTITAERDAEKAAAFEAAAKINALSAEIESLKAAAKTVEQRAAQMAATVGVAPIETIGVTTMVGEPIEQLWRRYDAIQDVGERRAFYLANIKPRL